MDEQRAIGQLRQWLGLETAGGRPGLAEQVAAAEQACAVVRGLVEAVELPRGLVLESCSVGQDGSVSGRGGARDAVWGITFTVNGRVGEEAGEAQRFFEVTVDTVAPSSLVWTRQGSSTEGLEEWAEAVCESCDAVCDAARRPEAVTRLWEMRVRASVEEMLREASRAVARVDSRVQRLLMLRAQLEGRAEQAEAMASMAEEWEGTAAELAEAIRRLEETGAGPAS